MDDERLCMISIGVIIVLFGGLAAMTYVDNQGWPWEKKQSSTNEVLLVQEGDEVSVDYVGRFLGTAGEPGPVFDTSLPEVARDDSIPKAVTFQEKPTYDDLTFTVGSGQMIKGFEDSVLGKKEGQSYTVAIPPEKGYGPAIDALKITINATWTIPMKETLSRDDFEKRFPRVDLETMDSFVHPFWGWDVHIESFDPDKVVIWQQPVYGQKYHGFPWNTTVVDISTERNVITLHHDLEEIHRDTKVPFTIMPDYDPYWVENASKAVNEPPQEGLVTSIGGTITIDFNREVAGKTLVFSITINSIKRE